MKNKILLFTLLFTLSGGFLTSCIGDGWFEKDPPDLITDGELWKDPDLILGLLANFYNRLPQLAGDFNTATMSEFDDAMWSGHQDGDYHNNFAFDDNLWYGTYWDYTFIRDINLALENLETYGGDLSVEYQKQFNAEFRFVRAFVYFELVKRMGGVPIITHQLIYNGDGDVADLQVARSTEAETYDFIYDELEDIKDNFAQTGDSRTRANKYTALALESRAMLYAGSVAKYNNLMSNPIKTDGGEVGIDASLADDYYQKSLAASKEIIENSGFELYGPSGIDASQNYYDLFMSESDNEIIFAKDYATGKLHGFTYDNIIRSFRTDLEGSSILSPSLSLVESFDKLDGSSGKIDYKDADGNYIVYDNLHQIFEGRDARLEGTIIVPGSKFRSSSVHLQAGVAIWNDDTNSYQFQTGGYGSQYSDGGVLTGLDGPVDDAQNVSNTGFNLRKFVTEVAENSARGQSENWWPWFRLGEMYLNAAEASFELGQTGPATDYINKIREVHGGFPANSITTLTMDIIRNERRIELAFEDQRYFDLKRWRIADKVWNGDESDGSSAVVYGLFPYRVVHPGSPDDGKYIFNKVRPTRFFRARYFTERNYYSAIDNSVLNNNPKIVPNPFQ
ncbi:MAG: RagB/SusD family nutrient uptake outer membrane protein [Mangrovibacterium sp.]